MTPTARPPKPPHPLARRAARQQQRSGRGLRRARRPDTATASEPNRRAPIHGNRAGQLLPISRQAVAKHLISSRMPACSHASARGGTPATTVPSADAGRPQFKCKAWRDSHCRSIPTRPNDIFLHMSADRPLPVENVPGLTRFDLACGMPLGTKKVVEPLPRASSASLPEIAEQVCARLMTRDPVYMTFSGGGESAMALAVNSAYARSHGMPDPVPITLRHPGLSSPDVVAQQEKIIAHLRLREWERVEVEEDLELIGALGGRTLLALGLLWPAHTYTMVPLMERARVLVLITGLTDFFAFWRWAPLAAMLHERRRPSANELGLLASTLLPAAARARLARRAGIPPPMPWLRPQAERQVLRKLTGRQADVPLRFDRAVMTQITHRCFDSGWRSLQALAAAVDAEVIHPFYTHQVIVDFARAGGWRGFGRRHQLFDRLAGDLLPGDALRECRPGNLNGVFFGPRAREFAAQWSGEGIDGSIVNVAALRRNWLSDDPDPRTGSMLQYVWLHNHLDGQRTQGSAAQGAMFTSITSNEEPS